MTSWLSKSSSIKKKVAPEPVSYFQYNEGTFREKMDQVTFVTALYDMDSQNVQIELLLQNPQYNCIVFTEKSYHFTLSVEENANVKVYFLERKDWVANTKFIPSLWSQQVMQDPEIRLGRSAEEFQLNYEKKEFLMKAIQQNPFGSTDFVWLDPQGFSMQALLHFQVAKNIPVDRILVQSPQPFTADDIASSNFRGKQRVDNSILGASATLWKEYSKVYDVVMEQKLRTSGFIGDDLVMLHYVVIHKPNLFSFINLQK